MVSSGLQPDMLSYSIVMNAMCEKGDVAGARQILASMLASGVAPDMRVYSTLAKGVIGTRGFYVFELTVWKLVWVFNFCAFD